MGTPAAAIHLPSPFQGRYEIQPSKRNWLDLPAEIKNRIYRYVFEGAHIQFEDRIPTGRSCGYGVLLAVKSFYQEAKNMFYRSAAIRIEHLWGGTMTTEIFNANVLQHVEQIVVHRSCKEYHLPEILREMRSLKRIDMDHPEDRQEIYPDDGPFRVTDEELSDRFQSYFDLLPVGNTSTLLTALRAKNVEVCIPVMFWVPCRHGREIVSIVPFCLIGADKPLQYCEFNASGSVRRIKEIKMPFDETMGCFYGICKTKALIWLMIRLRWISIIHKGRHSSRLETSNVAKEIS